MVLVVIGLSLSACGGSEYDNSLDKYHRDMAESLESILVLYNEVVENPTLADDPRWKERMRSSLNTIQSRHQELQNVQPPAGKEDLHAAVLRASRCMNEVAIQSQRAVTTGSPFDLTNALLGISACTGFLQEVAEEMRSSN
jgi:hypothetical protein